MRLTPEERTEQLRRIEAAGKQLSEAVQRAVQAFTEFGAAMRWRPAIINKD